VEDASCRLESLRLEAEIVLALVVGCTQGLVVLCVPDVGPEMGQAFVDADER
jgi:hypothetical protein